MSRWRRSPTGRAAEPATADAGVVHALTRELAVAVVGDTQGLVERLRGDVGGEWPVVEELPGPPASGLTPERVRADALWFLVGATVEPWFGAVERLVSLADGCGAKVVAVVPLDVVADVDVAWLDRQLLRFAVDENDATARVRLECLAGPAVAGRLASLVVDTAVDRRIRASAAWALGCVACNTPAGGVMDRSLAAARSLATEDDLDVRLAGRLLQGMAPLVSIVRHGAAPAPDETALAALAVHHGWRISGAALDLLAASPARRREATVQTLLELAANGLREDELVLPGAERAVTCLAAGPASEKVITLIETLFTSSPSASLRREAAVTLVSLRGEEARDIWVALLGSTQVGDIATGERLLRRFGTPDDVPLALQAAHRLLRRKATDPRIRRHPPRGAELLAFLADHRGTRGVDALFVEVSARWEHLPPELHAWMREHLPWLGSLT